MLESEVNVRSAPSLAGGLTPKGSHLKWSWKIGEVGGIGIFVHSTFFILIGWIGLRCWQPSHTVAAVVEGVGFILALFGCVVLHEMGHALAAQRYGITTRDITLLPIGGLARLERMPEDPKQELVVAIAGPLVNVVIAAALCLGLLFSGNLVSVDTMSVTGESFLTRLMLVNVVLVVFIQYAASVSDGRWASAKSHVDHKNGLRRGDADGRQCWPGDGIGVRTHRIVF